MMPAAECARLRLLQTVTLGVVVEHGVLSDQHRAILQNGCEIERYESVELKVAQPPNSRFPEMVFEILR